jgi:hypothetical protein
MLSRVKLPQCPQLRMLSPGAEREHWSEAKGEKGSSMFGHWQCPNPLLVKHHDASRGIEGCGSLRAPSTFRVRHI